MNTHSSHRPSLMRMLRRLIAGSAMGLLLFSLFAGNAVAANSSWGPTLLVNTESFESIDQGDGTTNIEMRFGQTINEKLYLNRTATTPVFEFTRGLIVHGNLSGTGTLTISGATVLRSTLRVNGNTTVKGNLSGASLRVDSNADIWGTLSASGTIRTRGNVSGASLTFMGGNSYFLGKVGIGKSGTPNTKLEVVGTISGSIVRAQDTLASSGTLSVGGVGTFASNVKVKANLSGASLRVDGNADIWGALRSSGAIRTKSSISGASLTVDGNVTLKGQTYVFPTNVGSNGQVLTNNGSNTLSWASTSASGVGSGSVLFLDPQFPNTTYFASGSSAVGQLTKDYDKANAKNFYRWNTTKTTNNYYWMATRVRVPTNFSAWQASAPLKVTYRSSGGYLDLKLLDTANALVPLTGANNLRSASPGGATPAWSTATITGPAGAGTYTPDGTITILSKLTASGSTNTPVPGLSSGSYVDMSSLQINWKTSIP